IAAAATRRLRGDAPSPSAEPVHHLVSSDYPAVPFLTAGLVTLLVFPTMAILGLAVLMSDSGRLQLGGLYLGWWFLLALGLRLLNTGRIVGAARHHGAELFELLPQGPAFAWALIGAAGGVCALIFALPKHELNQLPDFVFAGIFLAAYLLSALAFGASQM